MAVLVPPLSTDNPTLTILFNVALGAVLLFILGSFPFIKWMARRKKDKDGNQRDK
jgi:hypothetical protein